MSLYDADRPRVSFCYADHLSGMRASIRYLSWLADRFAENPYDEDAADAIMRMLYDSFSIEDPIFPSLIEIVGENAWVSFMNFLSDDEIRMIIAALRKILNTARDPRLEGWLTGLISDLISAVESCLDRTEWWLRRSRQPPCY